MGLEQNADSLGTPALKVVGFQLWIHGRQFPDSQDYWDGNWLNVTAHCGANGASVWVSGAVVTVSDLARWMAECEALYRSGRGEAVLQPCEPNLLVTLRSSDRLGHILMRVKITPDHMTQEHRMDFEIDQSYLPSLMAQCRAIIEEYPIRMQAGVHLTVAVRLGRFNVSPAAAAGERGLPDRRGQGASCVTSRRLPVWPRSRAVTKLSARFAQCATATSR